jgi:ribosomal protein L33
MRINIKLRCTVCKSGKLYATSKNKQKMTGSLTKSKYCNRCYQHTSHTESKK